MECVDWPFFDMAEYVKQCLSLSVACHVWQLPNMPNLCVDMCLPITQTKVGWATLAALNSWASRTDPSQSIRYGYAKRAWEQRQPSQTLIMLCG